MAIRGRDSLLNPCVRVVMNKDHETFITTEMDGIDNRHSIGAVVYLKDMDCYDPFETIQTDDSLRSSALGPMVLDYLADQVAGKLVEAESESSLAAGADRSILRAK